jgi:predicted amino acid-binding ACT domain protein
MLMVVDIQHAADSFQQTANKLAEVGQAIGVIVNIQRMDIFTAMHRI